MCPPPPHCLPHQVTVSGIRVRVGPQPPWACSILAVFDAHLLGLESPSSVTTA